MKFSNVEYVLSDIEGTTTSVSFVYDVLFPYFRENIFELKNDLENEEVQQAFKATVHLANKLEEKRLHTVDDILATLLRWSIEDKKATPLKTLQGLVWQKGYESGAIQGHVFSEVKHCIQAWVESGLSVGIFSSGSVAAQKLIFGYSTAGDLTPFLSNYYDTNTGGKKEEETYHRIAKDLHKNTSSILFLSDIIEELEAADAVGFQTCQLVREGNTAAWKNHVESFNEIDLIA